MSALQLFTLAVLAALVGVSQGNCYGRFPLRPLPPAPVTVYPEASCYDDVNALLLLAKAVENSNNNANNNASNNINVNDLINRLLNALMFATSGPNAGGSAGGSGGLGGAGGIGGTGGTGGSTKPKPSSSSGGSLIDLGLLNGDDLLSLILAGQKVLDLNVGNGNDGKGGAVSNLLGGLL